MRAPVPLVVLTAVALAALVPGCTGGSGMTYPPDPLFINRKPVEAKADNAAPAPAVQLEPAVPDVPALVAAATRRPEPGPAEANRHPPVPSRLPPRAVTPASLRQ